MNNVRSNPSQSPYRPSIQPAPSYSRRLDAFVRRLVPMAIMLFVVLFLSVPIAIPGRSEMMFGIVMISVYFWSIFRPASMPAIGVFLLGILIDILNYTSPGIVIFVLLFVYGIGITQRFRLARLNFWMLWLIFTLICMVVVSLQWVLTSIFSLRLMPYYLPIFEFVLTIGFYPIIFILLMCAHRSIANPEQV